MLPKTHGIRLSLSQPVVVAVQLAKVAAGIRGFVREREVRTRMLGLYMHIARLIPTCC